MSAGKVKYTYEAVMVTGDEVEFTVESANPTEKKAYLKHFLEVNRDQDVYFIDNLTGDMYNKQHIVKCKEKAVSNG
jgi:hypothetical protein